MLRSSAAELEETTPQLPSRPAETLAHVTNPIGAFLPGHAAAKLSLRIVVSLLSNGGPPKPHSASSLGRACRLQSVHSNLPWSVREQSC